MHPALRVFSSFVLAGLAYIGTAVPLTIVLVLTGSPEMGEYEANIVFAVGAVAWLAAFILAIRLLPRQRQHVA
jgi:hypothetical protein